MLLKELIDRLNMELESLKGFKFDSYEGYHSEITKKIKQLISTTELNGELDVDINEISFIRSKNNPILGCIGETLMSIDKNIDKDNVYYPNSKGQINSIKVNFNSNLDNKLLNYDLNKIKKYMDKCNLEDNIRLYNSEIYALRYKLSKMENQRKEYEENLLKLTAQL